MTEQRESSELERAQRFLGKVFVLGETKYSNENIAELLVAYKNYVDPLDSDLDAIEDYIEEHKLWSGGNERDFTYRRNYLYKYIREKYGFTYRAIGQMFRGKHHATVLHGIRLHDDLTYTKDPVYSSATSKLRERFKL